MDGDQTVDANGTYNGTVIDYTDPDVLPWCGEVRPYAILWSLVKWWALKVVKYYELPLGVGGSRMECGMRRRRRWLGE